MLYHTIEIIAEYMKALIEDSESRKAVHIVTQYPSQR